MFEKVLGKTKKYWGPTLEPGIMNQPVNKKGITDQTGNLKVYISQK